MKRAIFISISSLLIIISTFIVGCEDANPVNSTTTTELVPGQLDVRFTGNVTVPEANTFLMDLSLQPIDLSSLESSVESNWTVVGVPEGQEKIWTKKLPHYPLILSAKQKTRTTLIE